MNKITNVNNDDTVAFFPWNLDHLDHKFMRKYEKEKLQSMVKKFEEIVYWLKAIQNNVAILEGMKVAKRKDLLSNVDFGEMYVTYFSSPWWETPVKITDLKDIFMSYQAWLEKMRIAAQRQMNDERTLTELAETFDAPNSID